MVSTSDSPPLRTSVDDLRQRVHEEHHHVPDEHRHFRQYGVRDVNYEVGGGTRDDDERVRNLADDVDERGEVQVGEERRASASPGRNSARRRAWATLNSRCFVAHGRLRIGRGVRVDARGPFVHGLIVQNARVCASAPVQ